MVGPEPPEEFPELLDVAEEASLLETGGPTLKAGVVANTSLTLEILTASIVYWRLNISQLLSNRHYSRLV